jgi:hypothetical protein
MGKTCLYDVIKREFMHPRARNISDQTGCGGPLGNDADTYRAGGARAPGSIAALHMQAQTGPGNAGPLSSKAADKPSAET